MTASRASLTSGKLNVNATASGTVTANQGTANTAANSWPVEVTDGTNILGTAAHPLQVSLANTAANATAVKVDGSAVTQPVSGTVSATQGTSPWVNNISQIAGASVATAASGVQKVGVVGNAGAAFDAATNAAPPANAIQVGGVASTALPSAFTATDLAPFMLDKFGRLVVLPQAPRDLIAAQATTITNNTANTIVAAIASVFTDIISLVITNSSATPVVVTVSDGTASYLYSIAANGGMVVPLPAPLPATTVNTAWTATSSASVSSLYVVAQYVKNR
ncbi:MAG: hypothetical protein C5B59_08525 [Bacteroidetes bacterium]|nr:MAG: hypothetical protein C5B59_08525 [Bacteroidota bacterium]